MHGFYERADQALTRMGSSRNRFCTSCDIPFSSLQNYWHSDKLPQGDVLEKFAQFTKQSLDYLVMGRTPGVPRSTVGEIVELLDDYSDEQIEELKGAIRQYIIFARMLPSRGVNAERH